MAIIDKLPVNKKIVITIVCTLLTLIIFNLIIWEGIYHREMNWEHDATKGKCLVANHTLESEACSDYPTMDISENKLSKRYLCYNAYLDLQLDVNGESYNSQVQIAYYDRYNEAMDKLNKYPIGDRIDCWYNENNPYNVKIELLKPIGLILFSIFGSIFFLFCVPCINTRD